MVYLARPVFDEKIYLIGPNVGIDDGVFAGMAGEAADGFESCGLARAPTADDAIQVRAEVDALPVQESAGHTYPLHKRDSWRDLVFDAYTGAAVVECDTQAVEGQGIHLVAGHTPIAEGVVAQCLQCMRV